MKISWDDDIPNTWKVIKFHGSKSPTRMCLPEGSDCQPTLFDPTVISPTDEQRGGTL